MVEYEHFNQERAVQCAEQYTFGTKRINNTLSPFLKRTSGKPVLCTDILFHRDLGVLELILESCGGIRCIVALCMLHQGGFVHVTPHQAAST